jgi:phosphoglycolate phosphatase
MKYYRHIAWDWNGTLMDDVWLSLRVINTLLGRRGIEAIDVEHYREVFGFPLRDYCQSLGFDFGRYSFEELSDEFADLYEARRCECALHIGVDPLFKQLLERGCKLSLLSAYGDGKLCELVGFYGIGRYFSHVIGLDNEYGEGKVARGRRCMKELAWSADEMLSVGDTLHDFEVAEAMGIDCVLVAAGHQTRERLETAGCPVVTDLNELSGFLLPPRAGDGCADG